MTFNQRIQNLYNMINNLQRKVNCVCNRPNIPQPPTEAGTYLLTYDATTGIYEWTSFA